MRPEELFSTYIAALNIVSRASVLMQEGFNKKDKGVTEKQSHDLVTDYDKQIENFIRAELKQLYPHHAFLGEETSNGSRKVPAGLAWVLDPIDGTSNFVHSASESAISLALTQNKQPLIGIISCPMLNKLYSACKGRGSFLNGSPIHTSTAKSINDSIIAVELSAGSLSQEILEKLGARAILSTKSCHGIRTIGSAAISLAYVAQGIWDVYHCEGLYPWDYAAGVILVKEAGGHITDSLGGEFDIENSKILATNNKNMAKQVAEMFKSLE